MKRIYLNKYLPPVLLFLSIVIQAIGSVLGKYAAGSQDILTICILYFAILGGMGIQIFVWQYSLKYYQLSFAFPIKSLVNFFVVFAAFILFKEPITTMNIIGLIIITIGVTILMHDNKGI